MTVNNEVLFLSCVWLWTIEATFLTEINRDLSGDDPAIPFADAFLAFLHAHFGELDRQPVQTTFTEVFEACPHLLKHLDLQAVLEFSRDFSSIVSPFVCCRH